MPHRAAAFVIGLAGLLALPASAGAQAGTSYLIPPGNPFAGQAGAAPEVWAYGFRNPYRFSFDRDTGNLVVGDVGSGPPDGAEEVNVIPGGQGGLNFGWPCREGGGVGPQDCNAPGAIGPVHSYATGLDDAITGGYVVREAAGLPDLVGQYLYSDYSDGTVTAVEIYGSPSPQTTSVTGNFISFGEDALGRLYVSAGSGEVLRLVDGSPLETAPVGDFAVPSYVTAPPGDASRLLVTELGGTIQILVNGQTLATPFLDISGQVSTGSERGLFSMAFPPDYATSGRFYVFYTDNGGDLRIDEFRRSTDANRADPSSQRSVLTVEHSSAGNHNGGQLQFGSDGFLYISTGDGGNQGDPERDGQNLATLLGKILRIDPDPTSPAPSLPIDTDPPGLSARAPRRQRLLRLGGAVAYARCDEPCTVSMAGRLRVGKRRLKLKAGSKSADAADQRLRLKAKLTRRARRALRRALRRGRRPRARLTLTAQDLAGNPSASAVKTVRARR